MALCSCFRRLIGALLVLALGDIARAADLVPLPAQPPGVPFPTETWPQAPPGRDVDPTRLAAALDRAFVAKGSDGVPDTRALLAIHRGAIEVERYAPGFYRESRFESWSMAKTVTQALVAILVRQGRLDIHQPVSVAGWSGTDDPRAALTTDQLLHMTSGLANGDGNGPDSFAARLLFGPGSRDVFAYATDVPLAHAPGTYWEYSTATSMIVAQVVGRTVGGGKEGLLAFMRDELFAPLGMQSAVPEFDAAGTFLGGASVWATARDWGRLGLLYLRDGRWAERRVLPEGWVDYSRTPSPAPNNGAYGAHLWTNFEPKPGQWQPFRGGPASLFVIAGNGGQFVAIFPEQDLIVVRLGETRASLFVDQAQNVLAVAGAFPGPRAE